MSSLSNNRPSTANTTTTSGGGRRRQPPRRLHRSSSPPPTLPSSAAPTIPSLSNSLTPSLDSFEPGSPTTLPIHPLRLHPAKYSHDNMNGHPVWSRRSIVSNSTSRSRTSQISMDSMPSPAYAASGENLATPQTPLDENMPRLHPSKSLPPFHINDEATEHPSPLSMPSHNRTQRPFSPARSPAETEVRSPANYTAFPIPRSSTSSSQGSSTRINAWVSDQAEASNHLSTHRQSIRVDQSKTASALQSLTIPEGKAVGVVRTQEHGSINFDSVLTPMLSQLGNFQLDSVTNLSPSLDASGTNTERTRMPAFSQTTSMSSAKGQFSPPQTYGETNSTRIFHVNRESSLSSLILPASALESRQSPIESLERPSAPTPSYGFLNPREDWPTDTRTVVSDQGSISAGFSVYSGGSHPSIAFPHPREPETAIGPRSSLYALAGFCAGATQFKASNHVEGVRKVAGHVAGVSTATARCGSCSYGHAFTEFELDINERSPRATFPRPDGVLFRIRLLYKSHMVSQRPSEAFYGCIFCTQLGNVVYEGDATVFRSSNDLFRHLARHPQPLPEVPGVKVLYGQDILTTDPSVNDFDLWLGEVPKPLPEVPLAIDLTKLPVATAVKNHVQRYMEKKLTRPEGKRADQLLQFFLGARIIGVEFPAAFGGKWCTGFHDGEWGYFPSKLVELEKPRPGRLDAPPLQFQGGAGGSNVKVVTRFKWDGGTAGASEKGWLSFDRGEKITNVGWPVLWEGVGGGREAWCWSGTNAKGRFGVFPRSHVDESTLRDDARPFTAAGGAGNHNSNGAGPLGWRRDGGHLGAGKAKSLFRIKRRGSLDSSRSGHSGGVVEIIR